MQIARGGVGEPICVARHATRSTKSKRLMHRLLALVASLVFVAPAAVADTAETSTSFSVVIGRQLFLRELAACNHLHGTARQHRCRVALYALPHER